MKTKIIVRSFFVYDFVDETIDEQIERKINDHPGRLIQVVESPPNKGQFRVRVYLEVPDNTEETQS